MTVISAFPFLNSISQPSQIETISNQSHSYTISVVYIFLFYVVTSAFLRLTTIWFNNYLSAVVGNDLSVSIFSKIINLNYLEYLAQNSNDVITTLTIHIDNSIVAINNAFGMGSAVLSALGIFIALGTVQSSLLIYLGSSFLLTYGLIVWIARPNLLSISSKITTIRSNQVKIIQESLGSFRDNVLYSLQQFTLKEFQAYDSSQRKMCAQQNFIAVSPKTAIEALGIVFLVVFVLLTSGSSNASSIIPLIGTFAIGAQRLLPALQQIYSSIANISSTSSDQRKLVYYLSLKRMDYNHTPFCNSYSIVVFENQIVFDSVSFVYPQSTVNSLSSISLSIKIGDCIGIIGESGSGKSTFLDLLMGLISPSTGQLLVDNVDIVSRATIDSWQRHIAHVPQEIFIFNDSVINNITLSRSDEVIDYDFLRYICELCCINSFLDNLPHGYQTILGERGSRLSGGQKQRIGIARALYRSPEVLVLDEATSALDYKTEKTIVKNISSALPSTTIIMVTHRSQSLEICNKVFTFDSGSICISNDSTNIP